MNKSDIEKWISDNEQDIFLDEEEPTYIPSHLVEDFIEELMEKQANEILEMKQKALEAFRLFITEYCEESGRKDISAEWEHYMKIFNELINH